MSEDITILWEIPQLVVADLENNKNFSGLLTISGRVPEDIEYPVK